MRHTARLMSLPLRARERRPDTPKKMRRVERLFQKADRPGFESTFLETLVRKGGDEDHRNVAARVQQMTVQLEAVQSRHINIRDDAGRLGNAIGMQERFGRHERSSRETNRFDQLFRRLADEVVIVNDRDQWDTNQCHLPAFVFEA